ncbi:hypothetical protein B0I21_107179 [Sphingobacterium paludis]|uniref:Uncharacterized protein n=1 Tax=Sphingobacterium paludis TaxID=1476465 RepID=A0A4R7CTT2_9SPHI|nr:hypothetical protein B0I21_107179 [Sphingobacterium paludis]
MKSYRQRLSPLQRYDCDKSIRNLLGLRFCQSACSTATGSSYAAVRTVLITHFFTVCQSLRPVRCSPQHAGTFEEQKYPELRGLKPLWEGLMLWQVPPDRRAFEAIFRLMRESAGSLRFNDRYQLELYVESYAARRGKNYVKIRISKSGVLSKMRIA